MATRFHPFLDIRQIEKDFKREFESDGYVYRTVWITVLLVTVRGKKYFFKEYDILEYRYYLDAFEVVLEV